MNELKEVIAVLRKEYRETIINGGYPTKEAELKALQHLHALAEQYYKEEV